LILSRFIYKINSFLKITTSAGGSAGFPLTEDQTIDGDYYLVAGTLDLAGHALTINGNLIQGGGEVIVNGGTLNVNGDYLIQSMTKKRRFCYLR
jgi:hypothetical protein